MRDLFLQSRALLHVLHVLYSEDFLLLKRMTLHSLHGMYLNVLLFVSNNRNPLLQIYLRLYILRVLYIL